MRDAHPQRGEIYWMQLDPTIGTETKKTRPCLIISNNSQNKKGARVIALPITSNVQRIFPFEAKISIKGRDCKVLVDQIRALDRLRITTLIDVIDAEEMLLVEAALKVVLAL